MFNKLEKKMIKKNDELQWQAEDDARTMARYQEIMNDKQRANRAIKEAQKQARVLTDRANAMSRVANARKNKK